MAKFIGQAGVIIIIAMFAFTLIVFFACSGRGSNESLETAVGVKNTASGGFDTGSGAEKSRKLDALIADIGSFEPPAEVDPVIFESLKTALIDALSRRLLDEGTNRIVSSPPQGDAGKVTDFIYDIEAGVLKWRYANKGDYDLSGEVGIPDITPVALNYGAIVHDPESRAAWVDGDGNGEVGISDITPIALAYLNSVVGYRILTSETEDGEFVQVGEIFPFGDGGVFPKLFEVALPEGVQSFIAVEPVDVEGTSGSRSDVLDLGAPPSTKSVSPLFGFTGSAVRFRAEITGVAPMTFLWDFGGGALPNESTDELPSVVFGEPGEYAGTLTVQNYLGSNLFEFGFTISKPVNDGPGDWATFGREMKRNRLSPNSLVQPSSYKWRFDTDAAVYSSPAIAADGTVYFGCLNGMFYAVDPDGGPVWEFDAGNPIYSSPTIGPDGTIYFGCDGGTFLALNSNGSPSWTYLAGDDVDTSPAISPSGVIYFGSWDGFLYALALDGSFLWKFETGEPILSSPALADDGTIFFGSDDNSLYAVNPNGTLKWVFPTSGDVDATPAIGADGTIYIGSWDTYFYAVAPDGAEKWRYKTWDYINSSAAIGADGTVYFGSYDSLLFALTPDGELDWSYETGSIIHSSPAVDANGFVYFGGGDGFIYALTSGGALRWRKWDGSLISSSPAISDSGVLYIGVGGGLAAVG